MYKLYKTTNGQNAVIKTNEDGSMTSFILDAENPEEQTYLAWLAEGNTPEPAEENTQ